MGLTKRWLTNTFPLASCSTKTCRWKTLAAVPRARCCRRPRFSPDEVALFERYVEGGGGLLITGHSGLFGRYGEQRKQSSLERLIGARVTERLPAMDNLRRLGKLPQDEAGLLRDIPPDWPFLVEGPALVYRPGPRYCFGRIDETASHGPAKEGPGGTVRRRTPPIRRSARRFRSIARDRGSVLTFACGPDFATAGEHPVPEARYLLRNAIRRLDPDPAIAIKAPLNVESVVTDDKAQRVLRVHLIGYLESARLHPVQQPAVRHPALGRRGADVPGGDHRAAADQDRPGLQPANRAAHPRRPDCRNRPRHPRSDRDRLLTGALARIIHGTILTRSVSEDCVASFPRLRFGLVILAYASG